MSSSDDNVQEPNFKAFDKIQKFLRALKESFGDEFPEVTKYYYLCKKINFDNHKAIHFQNKIFSDYCEQNKEAIKNGKLEDLLDEPFVVNDKIQFNLKQIITKAKADDGTKKNIVKFLQYILYCLEPDVQLKTALTSKSKEDQLFDNLLNKMTNKYSNTDSTNINDTFQDLASSGFMDEVKNTIGGGIQSGEIDPDKLLTNAFGMFQKIKGEINDPGLAGMMNMVEGLLSQAQRQMQ